MMDVRKPAEICRTGVLALLLVATGAGADVYKCRDPAGKLTYQSRPCEQAAEGTSLSIDAGNPGAAGADSDQQDYSIDSQARRMKAEREALSEQRRRARRQAEIKNSRPIRFDHDDDVVRCARSREALRKWQDKARLAAPSDLDPITAQRQVEHYESQVARYCD